MRAPDCFIESILLHAMTASLPERDDVKSLQFRGAFRFLSVEHDSPENH